MAISAEKVETLRRKIATEKEIARIWEYFFDEFTGSPGFMEAGETCECRELDDRLELIGRHAFGKPRVVVSDQAWGHVRECDGVPVGLIHGSCSLEGRLASAIWLPDLSFGVACIMESGATVKYARFKPGDLAGMPARPGVQ
jgi:hypothetical protein